jgi:rhodanese-related sulfurtransferase
VKLAWKIVALLALAAALAAGLRAWAPAGLDWSGPAPTPDEVSFAQATALGRKALWVDARPGEAFLQAHVPGAINLYDGIWEEGFAALMAQWTPDFVIVVYCDDAGCQTSRAVAERLRKSGLPEVHVLTGGWDAARQGLTATPGKAAK